MKSVILSNVNIDQIANQLLADGFDIWKPLGYGVIQEALIGISEGKYEIDYDKLIIVVEIAALCADCASERETLKRIDEWFEEIGELLPKGKKVFISDAICRISSFFTDRSADAHALEIDRWNERLFDLCHNSDAHFILPISKHIEWVGTDKFFSDQLWYLGRIPFSGCAQNMIISEIESILAAKTPKKVLAVDLDNTLWGGVVGELGFDGIDLSDERVGLVYKDVQRELLRMTQAGVILVLVSKNNESDVLEVFEKNGHMIIGMDDVASYRFNWNPKDINMHDIANELNVGLESFVFLDDNPTERALIEHALPQVTVLDFPRDIAQLPRMLQHAYEDCFKQSVLTQEDRSKAAQYSAQKQRESMRAAVSSYDEYLRKLELRARRVAPANHISRIAQLVGKTNQFNLTTKRYTEAEIADMVESPNWIVFAYEIEDKFGNNGITALAFVDIQEKATIDTFILSCRIMGKNIEQFVVEQIEAEVAKKGFSKLYSTYRETPKNVPVRTLYDDLGYEKIGEAPGLSTYMIDLPNDFARCHFVTEVVR